MNGQNRQKSRPLGNSFATVDLYPDTCYDYSLNQPRDETIVGSGPEGRNTEWQINNATIGPDTNDFSRSIFPGAPMQVFPADKINIKPWFTNGCQTYGKWSKNNSVGLSNHRRPRESRGFFANY
jgi:hypothetical protein